MSAVGSGPVALKAAVREHWNRESCGEGYARTDDGLDLEAQEATRYALEPYLAPFARFDEGTGKDVLEIGVGMGADHAAWARWGPRKLAGVDLTPRGVDFTRERLAQEGLSSDLRVADAEALPFADASFDIVYSWGVLHHSPDTPRCLREALRVLRPGGVARIMIYNRRSLTGLMLWARYGLLAGRPDVRLDTIYAERLESPGTKAYEPAEAAAMMAEAGFADVRVRPQLNHGDLLQGQVGARHRGPLLAVARALWPRPLLRLFARRYGLYLLIEARKPRAAR